MRAQEQLSVTPALVDALFEQEEVGLAVWDAQLRFARVNAAFAAMNGAAPADHIGRTLGEMPPRLEALVRDVAESGSAAVGLELSGEGERDWCASYHPLRDADREVVGVAALGLRSLIVVPLTMRGTTLGERSRSSRRRLAAATTRPT